MLELLTRWLVLSAAVWLTGRVLPGFDVRGVRSAALVAALLSILHVLVGKILFVLIGVGTLGLGFLLGFITRWVVTALLLSLVDSLLESFEIKSFRTALIGAVLFTLFSELGDKLVKLLV